MTPERLREIEARCEAATTGPWSIPHAVRDDVDCDCAHFLCEDLMGSVASISIDNGKPVGEGGNDCPPLEQARANALLIANCQPDILDLLAALKQCREERDGYAAALDKAYEALRKVARTTDDGEVRLLCMSTQTDIADPAECLKARDAELRQSILNEANSQIRNARSGGFGSGSLEMFRNWLAKQKESDRQENAE